MARRKSPRFDEIGDDADLNLKEPTTKPIDPRIITFGDKPELDDANLREFTAQPETQAIAERYRKNQPVDAPSIMLNDAGEAVLFNGGHRAAAAVIAGRKRINVEFFKEDGSPADREQIKRWVNRQPYVQARRGIEPTAEPLRSSALFRAYDDPPRRKNRAVAPAVREAVVNLRIAGMSERAIYEGLRSYLDEVPSYRDLRAVYAETGVLKRSDATARRHAKAFVETRVQGRQQRSDYLTDRRTMHTVDFTSDRDEAFDRKFLLGYLARAGLNPDLISDESFAESLESIYEGEGS